MKIHNKMLLRRVVEVSIATGLVLTTFGDYSNNLNNTSNVIVEEQDDTKKDVFVTRDEIKDNFYYIICIDDINYDENVYITKINSYVDITDLGNNEKEYYYHELFSNNIMGTVFYDRDTKDIRCRVGPDILYAISLDEYLNEYNIDNESFTKLEMLAIYNQVREDYSENNFKDFKKDKVYIRDRKYY